MRPKNHLGFLAVESAPEGAVLRLLPPPVHLDDSNAARISEALHLFLEDDVSGPVIFDLAGVEFLSSSALGVFVGLHKQLTARGGRLTLRNLNDSVHEVFEVTKLTRLLDVHRQEPPGNAENTPAASGV